MLVVFEIDDKTLTVPAAAVLAERETLWVFCDSWKIFQGTDATMDKLNEKLQPPSDVKPSKRTASKKVNGSTDAGPNR